MTGLVAGIGIKTALGSAGGFLKAIPRQVWIGLAIIAALAGAYFLHGHQVKKHDVVVRSAEDQVWQKKLDAAVAAVKAKDAQLAGISAQLRKANDEANSAIASSAHDIGLLGPGKAACSRVGSVAAAASGPVAPRRPSDAAVAPLPSDGGLDLIGLPFDDALNFGADHDYGRAENLSWRVWYQKLLAAWPKSATAK